MCSGNLIVEGDNLHALKALLPRYAGKVKCICIDPPYNTGNEGWIYNDILPRMRICEIGRRDFIVPFFLVLQRRGDNKAATRTNAHT